MHAPEPINTLFNQANHVVQQKSQDADGQDGRHKQIRTKVIARIDDQEAQTGLRADHFSGDQKNPGGSKGEMQSCSNPGENGRKNDFCQNMGLTDAKIAGDFQIDGIYISDGRDRSQKNGEESGDKNDNKGGHFANAEK